MSWQSFGFRIMSDEKKDPSHSTVLHLGKFAAGAEPPSAASDIGATVMIQRAASETVEQTGEPILPNDAGALQPEQMLGAVSYCYAKGVYTSEEIERKMLRDPQLRESVHGEMPDAKAIRRFRRLNRGAIQRTLEKAFLFLRKKPAQPVVELLPGQPAGTPVAPGPGESTVNFVRHEAEQKLDEAAFIDNMSKD
jgi:hypothetical protein